MTLERTPTADPGPIDRAADNEPHEDPSVGGLLGDAARSAVAEIRGGVELVATEGRLAALSLAAMLAMALAAVVFIIATWLALAAALTVWLVSLGYSAVVVLLGVAAANLLLAWLAAIAIRALSRNLLFERTRRRLQTRGDADAVAETHGS